MAIRNPFFAPIGQDTPGIPESVANSINQTAQAYDAAYNRGNFGTRHPFITALAGGVFGPGGAFALPYAAAQADQQRKAGLLAGYNAYLKSMLENQQGLDKIAMPRNETTYAQSLLGAGQQLSQVNPNTPALPEGAPMSSDFLKNVLGSSFAGGNLAALPSMIEGQQARSLGLGQAAINPVAPATPGLEGTGLKDPTLSAMPMQAGVQETDAASLPVYMDPTLAGSIGNNLTSAANTALTQGVETGKANATLPATVQKLISEGKAAEALALLRGAETKTEQQRPALVKAQTKETEAGARLKGSQSRYYDRSPGAGAGGGRGPDPLVNQQRGIGILKEKRAALQRQGMGQGWLVMGKNGNYEFKAPQPVSNGWLFNGPAAPNPAMGDYETWRQSLNSLDEQISGMPTMGAAPPVTGAPRPAAPAPSAKAVSLLQKYGR